MNDFFFLQCDIVSLSIQLAMVSGHVTLDPPPLCSAPSNLAGKTIEDLTRDDFVVRGGYSYITNISVNTVGEGGRRGCNIILGVIAYMYLIFYSVSCTKTELIRPV